MAANSPSEPLDLPSLPAHFAGQQPKNEAGEGFFLDFSNDVCGTPIHLPLDR